MAERDGDRQIMETNVRDLVQGGVKYDKAQQMARESMIRTDRKLEREGKR